MNEETTRDMSDGRSFEERVFARFDSLDARVQSLEGQAERRGFDTKPIWERALAEIGEVKSGLGEVKGELGEVKGELGEVKVELGEVKIELGGVKIELREVKTGLTEVKERVGALEVVTKLMTRKLDILNRDLTTLRAEQLGLEDRVEKLEPQNLP